MIKEHSNPLSKFFHGFIEPTESIDLRDYLDYSLLPVEIHAQRGQKCYIGQSFSSLSLLCFFFYLT